MNWYGKSKAHTLAYMPNLFCDAKSKMAPSKKVPDPPFPAGPKIAETPLELLENDGTRETPFLSQIWAPTICGIVGFVSVIAGNWATRRPYFSGIQKHILLAAGCAGIGKVVDDYRNAYFADKDAVFRHYIYLHPEDFPPYERKKYSEVLQPWIPIR